MKKLFYFTLFSSLFLILSCSENGNPLDLKKIKNQISIFNILQTNGNFDGKKHGIMQLVEIKYLYNNPKSYYGGFANIYLDTINSISVNAGNVVISDRTGFIFDSTRINTYGFEPGEIDLGTTNLFTFGSTSTWSCSGNATNGILPFSTSMYVPTKFVLSNTFDNFQISKNSGITFTWNQDNNNALGVGIILEYLVAESRDKDSTLTSSYFNWQQLVIDNGSFTLTPAMLSQFPVGAYVRLRIGRGNYKEYINSDNKNYLLVASTSYMLILRIV